MCCLLWHSARVRRRFNADQDGPRARSAVARKQVAFAATRSAENGRPDFSAKVRCRYPDFAERLSKDFAGKNNEFERTFNIRSTVVGEILETKLVKQTFNTLDAVNETLLGFAAAGEISFTPELRTMMFGVDLGSFNADSHLIDPAQFAQIRDQARVVNERLPKSPGFACATRSCRPARQTMIQRSCWPMLPSQIAR